MNVSNHSPEPSSPSNPEETEKTSSPDSTFGKMLVSEHHTSTTPTVTRHDTNQWGSSSDLDREAQNIGLRPQSPRPTPKGSIVIRESPKWRNKKPPPPSFLIRATREEQKEPNDSQKSPVCSVYKGRELDQTRLTGFESFPPCQCLLCAHVPLSPVQQVVSPQPVVSHQLPIVAELSHRVPIATGHPQGRLSQQQHVPTPRHIVVYRPHLPFVHRFRHWVRATSHLLGL